MCTPADFPPYDEPLEDSIDWARLRQIRLTREQRTAYRLGEFATDEERANGLPQRVGWAARHADGMRHSEARRGR